MKNTRTLIRTTLTGLACAAAAAAAAISMPVSAQTVHVRDAWIPAYSEAPARAPVFMTLVNTGERPDRLLSASAQGVASVSLQTLAMSDDELRGHTLKAIELPAGVALPLEAGGAWLMLEGLQAPMRARATYTLTLQFEHAGTQQVQVRVRPTSLLGDGLRNLRTDPLQEPGQTQRIEGLDDALRTDPFLR